MSISTDASAVIEARLRDVPDFPQPGIVFKDIVPLLADGAAFETVICALTDIAGQHTPVDLVAGIEARGFIFAAALAARLGCGLVPVRKAGKLPPPTIGQEYVLEYGAATIEVPEGVLTGRRVFLVDDVLATGGTLKATCELVALTGAELIGCSVLIALADLPGLTTMRHWRVNTLLRY